MLAIACSGLMTLASAVHAADWAINLGQWSKHWRGDAENNTHHLVAVEYQGWTLGGMINSDDEASVLAGHHFQWPLNAWFTPGLRLGVATGYDNGIGGSGVQFGAVVSGFLHHDGVGVELNASPSGFVSAGLRWEF